MVTRVPSSRPASARTNAPLQSDPKRRTVFARSLSHARNSGEVPLREPSPPATRCALSGGRQHKPADRTARLRPHTGVGPRDLAGRSDRCFAGRRCGAGPHRGHRPGYGHRPTTRIVGYRTLVDRHVQRNASSEPVGKGDVAVRRRERGRVCSGDLTPCQFESCEGETPLANSVCIAPSSRRSVSGESAAAGPQPRAGCVRYHCTATAIAMPTKSGIAEKTADQRFFVMENIE
jgi:hypothetical protein